MTILRFVHYNLWLLQQTPPNKFSDISDLLESFYALNTKLTKKIPSAYTQENMDFSKLMGYGKKDDLICPADSH